MSDLILDGTGILIAINIVSFLVMDWDKKKSEYGEWRISEKTLFILALLFGGIGIYLGMSAFHHKTKKWYFQIGIPLLIALNIFLLSLAYTYSSRYF